MDSRYDPLATQFQYLQIDLLKAALIKHGIALDGQAYRPTIAFTADEENFLVQPDDVEYHPHAFNSTQEVFGQPDEAPPDAV